MGPPGGRAEANSMGISSGRAAQPQQVSAREPMVQQQSTASNMAPEQNRGLYLLPSTSDRLKSQQEAATNPTQIPNVSEPHQSMALEQERRAPLVYENTNSTPAAAPTVVEEVIVKEAVVQPTPVAQPTVVVEEFVVQPVPARAIPLQAEPQLSSVSTAQFGLASSDVQGAEGFQSVVKERDQLRQRVQELEQANQQLTTEKLELDAMLDDHGRQFLEALLSLENENEELTRRTQKLQEEREKAEQRLATSGSVGDLEAKNLQLERDYQDLLQQIGSYETELKDDVQHEQEANERIKARLKEQEETSARTIEVLKKEKADIMEMMSEEGNDLRARIEKLEKDKNMLYFDLAKANAHGMSGGGESSSQLAEVENKLRTLMTEREQLKDEVTLKNGEHTLLQNQLQIVERKLRLADSEVQMLRSELEMLRRRCGISESGGPPSQQQPAPVQNKFASVGSFPPRSNNGV